MDLQPTLSGETLTLRPLRSDDFEPLFAVASDPLIWVQHPEPTRFQRDVFTGFFRKAMESGGAFLVLDNTTGRPIGSSRYYDHVPERREVAIGYTFLSRSRWGGPANREMKRLLLRHAFRFVDTVWFHVGSENWRSRKAMEKIGGEFSHLERNALYGKISEIAFYRMGPGCALLAGVESSGDWQNESKR